MASPTLIRIAFPADLVSEWRKEAKNRDISLAALVKVVMHDHLTAQTKAKPDPVAIPMTKADEVKLNKYLNRHNIDIDTLDEAVAACKAEHGILTLDGIMNHLRQIEPEMPADDGDSPLARHRRALAAMDDDD